MPTKLHLPFEVYKRIVASTAHIPRSTDRMLHAALGEEDADDLDVPDTNNRFQVSHIPDAGWRVTSMLVGRPTVGEISKLVKFLGVEARDPRSLRQLLRDAFIEQGADAVDFDRDGPAYPQYRAYAW